MAITAPSLAHQAFYQDLAALLQRHASDVSSDAMLAIAAQMVGKIIALQDQRVMTPAMAMDIVQQNIELGNAQVIDEMEPKGKA